MSRLTSRPKTGCDCDACMRAILAQRLREERRWSTAFVIIAFVGWAWGAVVTWM